VKSWVDYLIAPGLSIDAATGEGKLGDTEMIVLQARGTRTRRWPTCATSPPA
jgi:FMN-dependent NADH-azoreductase